MSSKTLYFDIIGRDKSGSAAIQKVGQELLLFGAAAGAAVGLAVKKFADFDAQMAQVQTLSHATGAEMKQLTNAALTLGQGIGFTASQVADAETELTKAGIGVKDQLGGALVGTLNLAAAGQLDVASATEIAAAAMTQFKLSGKDVPHIADLLAAGADKALGSVDDLGQGLSFVGPVAKGLGVSLDQTVGTLSLFAQNGILGEKAGTGLRGVLLSLTSPSAQAAQVMDKYNISLYDAQGNFVGVDGAAEQLHKRLGTLDQATRQAALGQIFGNQQITAAQILMDGGAKSVDKWTRSVNDQGFAAEQARGKLDNLNGDLKKLNAAVDTALIKSGSAANDSLRNLTQTANGLVTGFANAPEPIQQTALTIGAVVAAATLLGGGFLVLAPRIDSTRMALRRLRADGISVGKVIGKGGLLTLGVAALGAGLAGANEEAQLTAGQLAKVNAAFKNDNLVDFNRQLDTMSGSFDNLKGKLNYLYTGDFLSSGRGAQGLASALDFLTAGSLHLSDAFKTSEAQFTAYGQALAAVAKTDLPTATSKFAEFVRTAGGGKEAIRQALQAFPEYKAALIELASGTGKTLNQQELFNLAMGKGSLAAELSTRTTVKNEQALADLAGQADDTSGSIKDLADAITNFGKGALDTESASRDFQAAIDDMTQSIADNGATLDINTEQGRANDAALTNIVDKTLALASAQANTGATTDTLTATMATGRQAFIDAATAAGLTADQAHALADKYGLIPANVTTAIGVTGADTASALVQGFIDKVNQIPGSHLTTLGVAVALPPGAPSWLLNGDGPGRAVGGDLDAAPGPKGVDSFLFRGAKGEHVLTASDVDAMGGQQAVYAFRRQLHGARAKAAEIGTVPSTYVPMPMPDLAYAPVARSGGNSTASTVVNVRVTQKVAGVSLRDLIQMEIETADGWQSLELESGVGR
jgi:TP901 family phage tail tape measure protein